MRASKSIPSVALACLFAVGCKGDEPEDGALDVRIWGTEYIEEGIPAEAFNDDWEVTFDRFVVALDGVATPQDEDTKRHLFDLTAESGGAGTKVDTLVSASGQAELAFRIGPGDAADDGNATDLITTMEEQGWSIFVSGTAHKDTQNFMFAWGFASDTTYVECPVATEVPEAEEVRTLITVQADRIFHDDLDDRETDPRFNLIATADADMDMIITADELREIDVTADEDYDVAGQDIESLWDFMEAQSATIGFVDGDGRCSAPEE